MEAQVLLDKYFETAFSAPDGVKKLRELILSLAMQGKLVPQDPSDQPASELLKQIEAEKERLIKEGKIKKSTELLSINPDEIPYKLPKQWECVSLNSLVIKIGSGSTPRGGKNAYVNQGIPFLRSQNIWNDGIRIDDVAYITEDVNKKMSETIVQPMDILLNITGASLGRCTLVPDDFIEANVSQHVTIIRCAIPQIRRFLHLFLLSPYGQSMIWTRQVGMSREGLSKKVLEQFPIPLPPLTEQYRIVEKINRLMEQCDRLEKIREEHHQKRLIIHTAARDRLLNAIDQNSLNQSWNFIQNNFGELYSVKENVSELRKIILQLAVMGKLVPQDPNDPPASELLKEIEAEKQKLIQEGKVKKQKTLPEIKFDEILYEIPKTWEWTQLNFLNPEYQNGISKRDANIGEEIIVLRLADINKNKISLANTRSIKLTDNEKKKYLLEENDLLIIRVNGSVDLVGNFIHVSSSSVKISYCDHFIRMKFKKNIVHINYICLIAKSRLIRKQIEEKFVTTAGQKTVNQTHINTLLFPLPPLPEQYRIVAKIDQLMKMCDQLEQQMEQSTDKQTKLLNAILSNIQ